MKHSNTKEAKGEYLFLLDFKSKDIRFSKPISYDSLSELCVDLQRLAKFYPCEWDFVLSSRRKGV